MKFDPPAFSKLSLELFYSFLLIKFVVKLIVSDLLIFVYMNNKKVCKSREHIWIPTAGHYILRKGIHSQKHMINIITG